jgi:deazaflavin-dependent oxidoreductase (nitroreductase family)
VARIYQVNNSVRFVNHLMARMIRWNIGPPGMYLLTVRGRKTGKLYSTPVTLVERDGHRWLVSPYGEVNWVKNARAAGQVRLFRAGVEETLKVRELDPRGAAPVLKEYLVREGIVGPYFDVQAEDSLEVFEVEAPRHPVFLLEGS